MKNLLKNRVFLLFLLIATDVVAQQDLKIIWPNGGEQLVVGTDVEIRWQGVPPQKFVILDYSTDNGQSWKRITDKATGLKHRWTVPNDASKQCLLRVNLVNGVTPADWVKEIPVIVNSIAYAPDGNIYVCGFFNTEKVDFGKGIIINQIGKNEPVSDYTGDMFLAKYDYYGNILWAKSFGGRARDEANSLGIDSNGNIFITGIVSDTLIDFGNKVFIRVPFIYQDYFFFTAKFNSNGEAQWAQPIKGATIHKSGMDVDLTVDKFGNVILAGQSNMPYQDTLDFGNGNFIARGDAFSNQYMPFVAKYDTNGNIQWVRGFKGYGTFTNVASDTYGNIYVSGVQSNKLEFNNGVISDTVYGYFLTKYSPSGIAQWATNISETANSNAYNYYNGSIAVDRFNNVYFTSTYSQGDLNFRNGVVIPETDKWDRQTKMFLVRYTSEGKAVWARTTIQPMTAYGWVASNSLATDYLGNIIVTGGFGTRMVDFGNSIILELTNHIPGQATGDFFLVKYDNSGRALWAKQAKGDDDDALTDMAIDPYGSIIISGWFRSDVLDFGIKDPLKGPTQYLAKYDNEIPVGTQDISDNIWTINKPEFSALNIDMGKVLLGTQKDSVITAFIRNEGGLPVDVRDIQLSGAQASEFQILTGKPPFIIPDNDVATVQFRFTPAATGIRQANLTVVTPIDNLYQIIQGEGVQPLISIAASLVDMGIVEIGSQKDTTLTAIVENIGSAPLKITNTTLSGAGKDAYTLLNPQDNFILEAGEKQNMQLRFSPQAIGQMNAELQFEYEGMTSGPAIARITGVGIGGSMSIENDSAYAGESRFLKINLNKHTAHSLQQQKPVGFKASLSYGNSIIAPTANTSGVTVANNNATGTVEITSEWNGTSTELAAIPFIATLGDRRETPLELLSFQWLNDGGEVINYDTQLQNGVFTMLGICEEGGTRLYDKDGKAQMMLLAPHPANGVVEINFETVERGATKLMLTDALGQQTVLKSGDFEKGSHSFDFDMQQLAAGIYVLTMQTPTQVFTQQVIVGK